MTLAPDTVLFATPMSPESIGEAQEYIKRQKLNPNDVKIVKRQKEGDEMVMICVVAIAGVTLAE